LITDTPWVRVYRIELDKNDKISIPKTKNSFLLITINTSMTDIFQNNKKLKGNNHEGDFLWIKAGESILITNKQNEKASFALLEIK